MMLKSGMMLTIKASLLFFLLLASFFIARPVSASTYSNDEDPFVVVYNQYFWLHNYFDEYYIHKGGIQMANDLNEIWSNISIGINFTFNDLTDVYRESSGVNFQWKAWNLTNSALIGGKWRFIDIGGWFADFYVAYRVKRNLSYLEIYSGINASLNPLWKITNFSMTYRMKNISISGDSANDFLAMVADDGNSTIAITETLPSSFIYTSNNCSTISIHDNATHKYAEFNWNQTFFHNENWLDIDNVTIRGLPDFNQVDVIFDYKGERELRDRFFAYQTWWWLDPFENRSCRADQISVNNHNNYYNLSDPQSSTIKTATRNFIGVGGESLWAIKIWLVDDEGDEYDEISGGGYVAGVARVTDGSGIQSYTWNSPTQAVNYTDSIIVKVYNAITGDGYGWVNIVNFTTNQLGWSFINASTWTVYYWTLYSYKLGKLSVSYRWGHTSYNSRIENIKFTEGELLGEWNKVEQWNGTLITRSWGLVEEWTGLLITRSWSLIESWTGTLITRNWSLVESWTGQLISFEWNFVEEWTGQLITRDWEFIESWTGTLTTFSWNLIESWTGQLVTRGWNLIEVWIGVLEGVNWRLVEVWNGTFLGEDPNMFLVILLLIAIGGGCTFIVLFLVFNR